MATYGSVQSAMHGKIMLFFLNSLSNLITKIIFGKVKKRTEIWNYFFCFFNYFFYIFCFHIMIKLILLLYETVVQFLFFFLNSSHNRNFRNFMFFNHLTNT